MQIVETNEHIAHFNHDGTVVIFQKAEANGQSQIEIGRGRLVGGIIRESGVNCGVLVHIERAYHEAPIEAGVVIVDAAGQAFTVETFEAPAHWATAFINGDTSGFSDDDQAEFDAWCEANPSLTDVVDCSEETHTGRFNGLLTDLATYTCHVRG